MSKTPTAHIHLDAAGVAWIDETNVKVIEVVLDKLAHGWSPEEIHFQHPDLPSAQIHLELLSTPASLGTLRIAWNTCRCGNESIAFQTIRWC